MSVNLEKNNVMLLAKRDMLYNENKNIKLSCNLSYVDLSTKVMVTLVNDIIKNTTFIDWNACNQEIGVILISNSQPIEIWRNIKNNFQEGFVSPLLFAAGNIGAPISVLCSANKFQGPTLNLTVPPHQGEKLSYLVASQWLHQGDAQYVLLITWEIRNSDIYSSACLLGKN